jgi:hypothetical protein
MKPTIFLPCKHVIHYDYVKNLYKMCPTCPLFKIISEVSTLVKLDPNDIQKKCTRESSISTKKSFSKKVKKLVKKKYCLY